MSHLTISLSEATHEMLAALTELTGETMQTVLDKAIENYRRHIFLLQANRAFAALRQNEELWQEEIEERDLWDQTISDGIEE
jgi:predicted DNA-binding protein